MSLLPLRNPQSLVQIIFHRDTDADRRQIRTIQCKLKLLAPAASKRPVREELTPRPINLPALTLRREGLGRILQLTPEEDVALQNQIR